MVIYEVNCLINVDSFTAFNNWLIPHVQQILAYPGFQKAYIAEQTDGNAAAHKKCLTVIYQITDQKHLDYYLTHHAPKMREDGLRQFPHQFTTSRRIFTVKETLSTS